MSGILEKEAFLFFIAMGGIAVLAMISVDFQEYETQQIYSNFCDSRPTFCYCNAVGCEFKTSSSSTWTNGILINNSMSEDTIALCKIATERKDKETIFKVGFP